MLEVDPARLMFDKAVQDAELEDELLTRHEQRSLGINEKRHIVNLHRTHNYNVANIECATSHHRDRHCDEYFDYRKEMRRKMIARTTKRTPTPYTVRRATRAEIVDHQERNVLILNHCVRNATAKTVCHLDAKVNNARKLRRTKHRREAAGPVAHVLGILRKREAQQRKSHAVFVASSKDPFVGAGEEAPGAAPAFDTFARSQTRAPRSKTEAMMLAQERRALAAVCGRDQVSTVMALNPGDATLFDKRFRKSMEKRGLYF